MKYATHSNPHNKQKGGRGSGRYVDPDNWCTGPDPIRHDKYYGYLKHKAQAKHRKEEYSLTWEDWESIWPDEYWVLRGRGVGNLCLQQITLGDGWHMNNIEVVTRGKHFADIKERNRLAKQSI